MSQLDIKKKFFNQPKTKEKIKKVNKLVFKFQAINN